MKYLYYVVYFYEAVTSSGTGSFMHESNEKIKSLDKINRLAKSIANYIEESSMLEIKSVVITNFILMDEVSE